MELIICPKCKHNLNEYEINKLWCTTCNSRFKSLSELYELQQDIIQSIEKEIPENQKDLIIKACKNCVEKHLKAPSTVNYISIDIKDRDNYGRVYLYVELDAQNSFGAYLRSKLHVILQSINEDGTYEALNEAVYKVSFINTEDVVKKLNKWNVQK